MDWSGLGQSVKSDAKGITGNITKAVLVFPDSVPSDINLKDGDAVGAFGAALGAERTGTYIHSFNMQNNGIKNISKAAANTSLITHNLESAGAGTDNLLAALDSGKISGK